MRGVDPVDKLSANGTRWRWAGRTAAVSATEEWRSAEGVAEPQVSEWIGQQAAARTLGLRVDLAVDSKGRFVGVERRTGGVGRFEGGGRVVSSVRGLGQRGRLA